MVLAVNAGNRQNAEAIVRDEKKDAPGDANRDGRNDNGAASSAASTGKR